MIDPRFINQQARYQEPEPDVFGEGDIKLFEPAMNLYGEKVAPYKSINKSAVKVVEVFLKWNAPYFIKSKILAFLLFPFILMIKNYTLFSLIAISICLVIIYLMKKYARSVFKKFRIDLLQSLFLEKNIVTKFRDKKTFTKKDFNENPVLSDAFIVRGEDYIEGFVDKLYFKLAELSVKGKIRWWGMEDVFDGLYFQAINDLSSVKSHWVLNYRKNLDPYYHSNEHTFYSCFEFDEYSLEELKTETPEFKEALVNFSLKYNVPFQWVKDEKNIYLHLFEKKNYFNLDFWEKFHGEEAFEKMKREVEFITDIIHLVKLIS